MASNLLKMYVDVELFLVTLVGLILRIENADLSSDLLPLGLRSLFPDSCGWLCTGTLYGDLLWILLLLTLVPIFVSMVYRSPEERAQALLHKMARVDADDNTSGLARRRAELRSRTSRLSRLARRRRGAAHQRGESQEQPNPLHGLGRSTFENEADDDAAGVGGISQRARDSRRGGGRAAGASDGLPAGWVQRQHDGRPYYVNAATGRRTWTRPQPVDVGDTDLRSAGDAGGPTMDRNVQPTIEEIFDEIDADRSGFVELAELEGWWRQNRGDEGLLQKFELAFRTVQDRQRTVGLSSEQFKKVIVAVAADNWMRRVDESGRPFVYNRITHEKRWKDPGGKWATRYRAVGCADQ